MPRANNSQSIYGLKRKHLTILWTVFIFGTMTISGIDIKTTVSDQTYHLGIKGQAQLYLKYVLWNVTRTHLSFFDSWCS